MLVDTFANRLRKALNIRGLKQVELSEKTKIDKSLISNYLKGKYEAKQNNIYIMAEALDVSEAWLMGYDVPLERTLDKNYSSVEIDYDIAKVFVYGSIPAGIPMECIEDILEVIDIPAKWLTGGKKFFGLKISGNSMYPEYLDKDIVIFEQSNDCENGDDCVVMVNGSDGTFKRVYKNENGIILQPINNNDFAPVSYSNEQIESLPVRILGIARELRRSK